MCSLEVDHEIVSERLQCGVDGYNWIGLSM